MTGETQLRARRTRIKILKAIADRNGAAGFSDIKASTGISTGSIYYHIERMGEYVAKDAKHYRITEEGMKLLRRVDPRYALPPSTPATAAAEVAAVSTASSTTAASASLSDEEPRQREKRSDPNLQDYQSQERTGSEERRRATPAFFAARARRHPAAAVATVAMITITAAALVTAISFGAAGGEGSVVSGWQYNAYFLADIVGNISAGVLPSAAAAAAVLATVMVMARRSQSFGYRGMMLSLAAVAALLGGIVVVSSVGMYSSAASSYPLTPPYDNSMDALLSSYSVHWQIR